MQDKFSRIVVAAGVALALGSAAGPVAADIVEMSWSGLFTMLDPNGSPLINTSYPYYGDPTWGYGLRTQISGTLSFDTLTGAGSATIAPFAFCSSGLLEFRDMSLQAIGDGNGGQGALVLGNMLFNWSGNSGIPISIVWDAAGLFSSLADGYYIGETISGVGALPASNGIRKGALSIGLAPMATTIWNTTTVPGAGTGSNPSGELPLTADSVGGSPMIAGPFLGFNINLDITSIQIEPTVCPANGVCPPPVPIPAAFWLFGSGLLGLGGISLRRHAVSS